MNKYWNLKIFFIFLFFVVLGVLPAKAQSYTDAQCLTICSTTGICADTEGWCQVQGPTCHAKFCNAAAVDGGSSCSCIVSCNSACVSPWTTTFIADATISSCGGIDHSTGDMCYLIKCTVANQETNCNDNNPCTLNTCVNGGTASAYCTNMTNNTCKWKPTSCSTTTGDYSCYEGSTSDYTFADWTTCKESSGCDIAGGGSCTPSCVNSSGYYSSIPSGYSCPSYGAVSDGCGTGGTINCYYNCSAVTCTPSCSSLGSGYYSSTPDGYSCTFQTFENNCHTGNIDCYYNCSASCPSAESCPTTCHTNTVTVPDGSCGTTSCPPNAPAAGVCPSTCHTNTVTVPNGSCGTTSCTSNAPAAVACPTCLTVGSTVPDGSCGTNTCTKNCDWVCAGGSCNYPPVINGLIIKNSGNTLVPVEVGTTRNQICDTDFNGSRRVTFEINASDVNIGDSLNYSLSWNGKNIPVPGGVGTTVIPVSFNNSGIFPFIITVNDGYNIGVTSSPRSFKFWDCKVPVSGTIYNGSDGLSCPDIGFTTKAVKDILNFKSLTFISVGSSLIITPNPDGVSYTSGSNGLTWGLDGYIPNFNLNDSKIVLSFPRMKSEGVCDWWLDTTHLDAYAANIGFTADFSGKTDQDPWWQAYNGGVISNSEISNQVPFTCTANDCRISFNGLAAAPIVSNSGDLVSFQDWSYLAKLTDVNKNYSYFYKQYFVKNGIGTTFSVGDKIIADIGSTGIYFVNGNLTIDNNKTINPGNFLMIIVSGDITVNQNVTRVDGILVANNITAGGSNNNQLVFNGSLFASNTIDFSRDHTVKSTNNTVPAVKVNYNPELMFRLPGKVAQILSNWQWGN